jgi:hypothetical protein
MEGFAWVNVYRPFDFIGSRLGGPDSNIAEFSTGQVFKNHPNCWRDPKVATLIAQGVTGAEVPATPPVENALRNWPPNLCVDSYQGSMSPLWRNRLKFFMAIFFLVLAWQLVDLTIHACSSYIGIFSISSIKTMAKTDGWLSAVFQWIVLTTMIIAGFLVLVRFLYKRVWEEWLGTYGSTLLGCIEEARKSPMTRYFRDTDAAAP